jgi:hypothetical protein
MCTDFQGKKCVTRFMGWLAGEESERKHGSCFEYGWPG